MLWLLLILMPLVMPLAAEADWSPEIVIWDSPPEQYTGGQYATVAVDSAEGVHIAYTYELPNHWLRLRYVKFDDHGHQLFTAIPLGDSLDIYAQKMRINFFGLDSMWVAWGRTNWIPDSGNGQYYRESIASLDINGNVMDTVRDWPRTPMQDADDVPIYVTGDRKAVFCYAADGDTLIRCVVQLPDGSRTLDHDVIVNSQGHGCQIYDVVSYQADSLQLGLGMGSVQGLYVATKRVATNVPFDSSHSADNTALMPAAEGWTGCRFVRPPDSLMAFEMGRGFASYLRVVRSTDYSFVAQSGPNGNLHPAFEPDETIGTWSVEPDGLHFKRYSFPELDLIEDHIVSPQWEGIYVLGYGVSSLGVRHVVYEHVFGPGRTEIIYRYWRSDLSAGEAANATDGHLFSVCPNPTNGELTIEGPISSVKSAALYNIVGQRVLKLRAPTSANQRWAIPEVSSLPSGTYFLHITSSRESAVLKIILDR